MAFLLRIYDPTYPPDPAEVTTVAFVWDAVESATSYVLQVGTASGQSDRYDGDVGNVLTYSLDLTTGVYFSRVVPQGAGETTAEQTVTV